MNKQPAPTYHPPKKVKVKGATASDGTPYISVSASTKKVWLPRDAFTGQGTDALARLKSAGMPLLKAEWSQVLHLVGNLKVYPPKPLIDRPGWNGPHFALADGTVFSPTKGHKPVVLFRKNLQKCAHAGTIAGWRATTAMLENQPLASFILMAAFSAPLLALTDRVINQGFEIAGPKGAGKSTLQRLCAAVCGPADDTIGRNYWITANATMNGLEQTMAEHNDMPMIIEETNLFAAGDSDKARAAKFNELVFKLSDGTGKRRHGDGDKQRNRFTFVTSTNEALSELLASNRSAVSDAASDRLLTIPINPDRPYKIFDTLPAQWQSSGDMARDINAGIRAHYGVGIRRFLRRLVRNRAADPEWLARGLKKYIDQFREIVGVDPNDGSAIRVADAFGLVYAVGILAIRFGALSKRLDPLRAALTCYYLNRESQAAPPSCYDMLMSMRNQPEVLRICHGKRPKVSDAQIEAAPAIVWTGRGGREELLLTDRQLDRAFPLKRLLFADPRVSKAIIAEVGRKQTKREIRKGQGPERFHCFRLDLDAQ